MNSEFEKNLWINSKVRKLLGLFIVIIGLGYTYYSHLNGCPHYIIFGGWAIGPPIWFIIEYRILFNAEAEDLHSFKYYQGLCRNLWIGFLVYLAAFYLGSWK